MIPILMLTKDRLEFTKKAVDSVLENTLLPFKLFVFDNDSEEKMREWLVSRVREAKNMEVYFSPSNVGVNGGMDIFHQRFSKAKLYAKVDNDTIVPKGWLIELLKALEGERVDLVGSIHHTYSKGALEAMYRAAKDGFCEFRSPGGSGILYRKSFVDGHSLSQYEGDAMSGWTKHCWEMCDNGSKAGFCGSVQIELLDMADHFKRKEGGEGWRGF